MPTRVASLEQVVAVARRWTLARFAVAQTTDFALTPHRFESLDQTVSRKALSPDSVEGRSPLDAVDRVRRPTAWAHTANLTVLVDTDTGTHAYEQEVVEILAMLGAEVLAEFAYVIRICGLAPCLGPFRT